MKKPTAFYLIFTVLCVAVLLASCYTTGGEDPGPVASISQIEVMPEVISPTDTVKITAVVTNLGEQAVKYKWRFKNWEGNWDDESTIGNVLNGIDKDQVNFTITDSSSVLWLPNGFRGITLVQFVIEPLSMIYDDASTAFTFIIE